MVATLVAQFMQCAVCIRSLPMGFYVKENSPTDPKSHLQLSMTHPHIFVSHWRTEDIFRERREHRVYKTLLQTIPGLEEQLMTGSEEEILRISDLVSSVLSVLLACWLLFFSHSFKKVLQVLGQMTPRAWRAPFSTGSLPGASSLLPHWPVMSRPIAGFTTSALAHYYVPLV